MKNDTLSDDPWQYAAFEGIERLHYQQSATMTLSERLEALDAMIRSASSFKDCMQAVHEESPEYKTSCE